MVESFLDDIKRKWSASTEVQYRTCITVYLRYLKEKNLKLFEVKKKDVEKFLLKRKCSSTTRKIYTRVIYRYYSFLKVSNNPVADIIYRRDRRKRIKLPPGQIIKYALNRTEYFNSRMSDRNRAIIELAFGSGLRNSEIKSLDIEDINFESGTACINGKGRKRRLVPLTEKSKIMLSNYIKSENRNSGPLFISMREKKRLSSLRIWQIFKEYTNLNPHKFRHACASYMFANGCSIRVIQALLGHENITTTSEYTHVEKEELRREINKYHARVLMEEN